MSKFTKIVALLMALVLCLSFAACGGKDEPETTTAPEATEQADAPIDEQTTAPAQADTEDETQAEGDVTTEAVTEAEGEATTEAASESESKSEADSTKVNATTAAKTTTPAKTTTAANVTAPTNAPAASKKPEGTAAIVEYFNTAVNKVKTNAKSVQQKYVNNYLAASATVPSGLSGIYKMLGGDEWLDGMLKDNSQGSATFSTKADIQAKFPVEGMTWASKLTAADVKSATCTEANGVYTITIITKPDGKSSTIDYGQGHAPKALNAVPPRIINDNIPGIATSITGTAAMNYPFGKVVITVDAATGNVKTADYDVQWTINFDKAGAIIPLGTKSSYVVTF